MPLSNSNFPFPGVQNKQERHRVFENMQGFYNNKTVLDYYKPVDSTKKTITYIWFNNQFIDPCKMYGLYKCLVINTKSDYDSLSNVATVPLLENLYSMSISGAVLDYNKTTDDYRLTIIDYDDKTRSDLTGSNEKCFHGIHLNLSGGVVGGIRLKKMKRPLPDFKNISFDTLYAQKI
jgi:hypothetical protein